MSAQDIILALVGIVCGGLGWWLRDLWAAHKILRTELSEFKEEVPKVYVSKSDFKDDMREIKETLRNIYDRIDSLARRP